MASTEDREVSDDARGVSKDVREEVKVSPVPLTVAARQCIIAFWTRQRDSKSVMKFPKPCPLSRTSLTSSHIRLDRHSRLDTCVLTLPSRNSAETLEDGR